MIGIIIVAALYLGTGAVRAAMSLGTPIDNRWGFVLGLLGPFGIWYLRNYRKENKNARWTPFARGAFK